MTPDSHAYLPAADVVRACETLGEAIRISREEVRTSLVNQYRSPRPWLWLQRRAKTFRRMPPELKVIVDLHRAEERASMICLMDLAIAAADYGEDFRVHVSASDFAMIKSHYRRIMP